MMHKNRAGEIERDAIKLYELLEIKCNDELDLSMVGNEYKQLVANAEQDGLRMLCLAG